MHGCFVKSCLGVFMGTSVFVGPFLCSRQDGTSNRSSHSFHKDANDKHLVVGIRCNLSPPPLIPLSPLKPGRLCWRELDVTVPCFSSHLYCSIRNDPNPILSSSKHLGILQNKADFDGVPVDLFIQILINEGDLGSPIVSHHVLAASL